MDLFAQGIAVQAENLCRSNLIATRGVEGQLDQRRLHLHQDTVIETNGGDTIGLIGKVTAEIAFNQTLQGDGSLFTLLGRTMVLKLALDNPGRDQVLAIEGADAADEVFQLAHIARPIMDL